MRKKDPNNPPKRFKSYRVPFNLYERAEAYAKAQGGNVRWTDVVKAVLTSNLP